MTSLPDPAVSAPRPRRRASHAASAPRRPRPGRRRALVAELGEPAFRAKQVSNHYFGAARPRPRGMTDLPGRARERLGGRLLPTLLTPVRELACDDGATRKTLWRLHDGALVESVLMGYPDRVTVCISSQAGCGMACPFCATGQAGLTRNLSTAEIVDQAVYLAGWRRPARSPGSPPRLSHVVFMGMGEPLANYSRVIAAIRRLIAPGPGGVGPLPAAHHGLDRGLVPAIRRLAGEDLSVTLALSLHAPDDDLRDELVPVNQRWKVAEVLDAAWDYAARTGRRVSIEYAMIRDVNDQPWRADLLGRLLAGKLAHVNLIPLNPTPGSRWDASPKPVEREFVRRLRAAGVATTVRDTRGREIDGACGQLAAAEDARHRRLGGVTARRTNQETQWRVRVSVSGGRRSAGVTRSTRSTPSWTASRPPSPASRSGNRSPPRRSTTSSSGSGSADTTSGRSTCTWTGSSGSSPRWRSEG